MSKKDTYSFGTNGRMILKKIKEFLIRALGLPGSWKWAQRQMIKGKIVRRKSTSGTVKYKFDDPDNCLLMNDFSSKEENQNWTTSNYFRSYSKSTDWYVFMGWSWNNDPSLYTPRK